MLYSKLMRNVRSRTGDLYDLMMILDSGLLCWATCIINQIYSLFAGNNYVVRHHYLIKRVARKLAHFFVHLHFIRLNFINY